MTAKGFPVEAFCISYVGKNIGLAYLPQEHCQEGREMLMEYLGEQFPMKVESMGYKPLYDPENLLPRS